MLPTTASQRTTKLPDTAYSWLADHDFPAWRALAVHILPTAAGSRPRHTGRRRTGGSWAAVSTIERRCA
jgi:hypothetical protein